MDEEELKLTTLDYNGDIAVVHKGRIVATVKILDNTYSMRQIINKRIIQPIQCGLREQNANLD